MRDDTINRRMNAKVEIENMKYDVLCTSAVVLKSKHNCKKVG